jgi:hypothetical protein
MQQERKTKDLTTGERPSRLPVTQPDLSLGRYKVGLPGERITAKGFREHQKLSNFDRNGDLSFAGDPHVSSGGACTLGIPNGIRTRVAALKGRSPDH